MDKVGALVHSIYHSGIRAYHLVDDKGRSVTYFQKVDGSRWPHEGAYVWDRLRAYQDEQRKKGVPIVFPDWDAENKWLSRDHGEIGVYRSSFAVRQEWGGIPERNT